MPENSLVIGDIAPDFTLPRDGGDEIRLSDQRPSPVVLFFYPRDMTPGCTTEATEFSALADAFAAAGVRVFGISKDSVASHDRFVAKKELRLPLLSDEAGDTCERYGVWQEKKMYGKTFMGIVRSTFLLDGNGRVARVWPKVKVAGHAQDVLDAARVL